MQARLVKSSTHVLTDELTRVEPKQTTTDSCFPFFYKHEYFPRHSRERQEGWSIITGTKRSICLTNELTNHYRLINNSNLRCIYLVFFSSHRKTQGHGAILQVRERLNIYAPCHLKSTNRILHGFHLTSIKVNSNYSTGQHR